MLASSPGHPSHLIYPDSACHGPSVDLRMFCSEVGRILMAVSQSCKGQLCCFGNCRVGFFGTKNGTKFLQGPLNGTHFRGIKQNQTIQISGDFQGFPENNNVVFGLVLSHDPCFKVGIKLDAVLMCFKNPDPSEAWRHFEDLYTPATIEVQILPLEWSKDSSGWDNFWEEFPFEKPPKFNTFAPEKNDALEEDPLLFGANFQRAKLLNFQGGP